MGRDHHKSDRYSTFARNWKLIGITSRKRWQKKSIQEKVLWRVLEQVSKSEGGTAIIRSACYETGRADGENLQKSGDVTGATGAGTGADGAGVGLETIELMCLLSGIPTELTEVDGKPALRVMNCPYSDILTDLCSPDMICECHLMGIVHATDADADSDHGCRLNRRLRMCAGDPYCEFVIE